MKDWWADAQDEIATRLEDFYSEFYDSDIIKVGRDFGFEICPICGHKNCARISDIGVNCFSCGWKGSHISAYISYAGSIKNMSEEVALKKIGKWAKIPFKEYTQEELAAHKKHEQEQNILRIAENFYHDKLLSCVRPYPFNGTTLTPLAYLLSIRKRKQETIDIFKIGFSLDYKDLQRNLMEAGYSKEDIDKANIRIPEGVFVFFYKNPITGDITRINTKNPFKQMIKQYDEFGNETGEKLIEGYSVGAKSDFYYTPGFSFKKSFIVVEGEHDLFATYENGGTNACCIGGNLKLEYWDQFEKAGNIIYTAFDNDEVGRKYTGQINDRLPEKDIRMISFPEEYKDIDEYYTAGTEKKTIRSLCSSASALMTEKFKISHTSFRDWKIENRYKSLEFELHRVNEKGQFVGTISLFVDKKIKDRADNVALVSSSVKASMRPMNFELEDEINQFFNTGFQDRSNEELIQMIRFSQNKQGIREILARRLIDAKDKDAIVISFREALKGFNDCDDIIDSILKEVNDIQNRDIKNFDDIPRIRICQYFNIKNNDAYMYFTNVKHDGETVRKLPYLVRNDKTLIRLDLYKRKDEQCLLLIDNKYELPEEQPVALNGPCLTQHWVEEWIDNKIPAEELNPFRLVSKIEQYFRRFYYTNDENIYKILALYCYLTYYYEALGEIPYLYLNGEKGSGKSILDNVLSMFCFNAKMGVSMTDAALFRMISIEGGTVILDEVENLTSRTKANDNGMGAILKGGYTKNSLIYRTNMDKNCVESFDSFGPKIISNIFGLEDVILDRCIQINTYRLKITKETRMEDPRYYLSERMAEIREITSKCCLSALENFQNLNKTFRDGVFEAETARLSQILTSMLAVAKLVDDSEDAAAKSRAFENALKEFYNSSIKTARKDSDESTPEGILKMVVLQVAKELKGLVAPAECEYTAPANHKYQKVIDYSVEEGWFKLDVIHMKCFMEENMPGDQVYTRNIPRFVKNIFNVKEYARKSTTIENDELLQEYRGNAHPKVNVYTFYFRDFIDDDTFIEEQRQKPESTIDTNIF